VSLETAAFIIVFVAAVTVFGFSLFRRLRLVTLGKPDNRSDNPGKRLWNVILYPFLQRCTINGKYKFGWNHAFLFWAFMVLLIANTEFLVHGLFPSISLSGLPAGLYHVLAFVFDIVSLVALVAVISAIVRRTVARPAYIESHADAYVILGLVASLMVAYFGLHGSQIASGVESGAYMPISNLVSGLFGGVAAASINTWTNFLWWAHALILLGFLNYLPYSKHFHIIASIPNCYLRSTEWVNTQPREQFVADGVFGEGQVDRYSWKDLFDTYACTECGRCVDNCPAGLSGKNLDPRNIIHTIKVNMLKNGPELKKGHKAQIPLIGPTGDGSVPEDQIWNCTTCGACMETCPVFIEHVPKIVGMRRHLVEMESKFPHELNAFFENMEQRSNPWGLAPAERTKWSANLDVKSFDQEKTEYLFYVGCAGAYDARNRQSTIALTKILDAAGVSWGTLGKDEQCCGDSLRRLGNELVFDRMATSNVAMFKKRGIKKIITQCPHCFSTLKNDYKQFGADLEVIHSSEFICRLIDEGKLKLNPASGFDRVVFHDSCYLGRHNGVYNQPRQVLRAATGHEPIEMPRHGEKAFCCGAGGGRMWLEDDAATRINVARTDEMLKLDASVACVCCPYCTTMFEDGVRDRKADERLKVMELSEIVASALMPKNDPSKAGTSKQQVN
jgi:Fe-S oxidoreductase